MRKTLNKVLMALFAMGIFAMALLGDLRISGNGISVLAVAKADTEGGSGGTGTGGGTETGSGWTKNYKMGTKNVQTGTTTYQKWILMDPITGQGYYETVTEPVYSNVSCCINATDSDACNFAAQNSHC